MELKVSRKQKLPRRNIAILLLLIASIGALYYNNVYLFNSYYSYQPSEFVPTNGAPLLSAGDSITQEKAAIAQDADELIMRTQAPQMAPLTAKSAPMAASELGKTIGTATYQEKGPLQEASLYYGAIAILGLMLILNIFKVSFQSSAVFDSDIFKTLSSDTRVEMLYSLQQRRKTLTELATDAKISLPGAKQHLMLLEAKGLVKQIDEGRKWKYYELTQQGKTIIAQRFA